MNNQGTDAPGTGAENNVEDSDTSIIESTSDATGENTGAETTEDSGNSNDQSEPLGDKGETTEDSDTLDSETLSSRQAKKRITRLTREKYDLMSENDRLLKASSGQEPKPVIQTATEEPVMPKLEDYDSTDAYHEEMSKYSRNMINYEIDRRDKTHAEAATQTQKEEQRYKSIDNFETKSDEYRKKNPDSDFDEVAKSPEALMIYGRNSDVAMMVQDSDVGPELAHYLGSNIGVLDEIATMSLRDAAREIGKLEAKIEQSGGIKPRAVSQAPNTITPVGGGQGVVTKDPSDMTDDEFIAWRRAHIEKRS